MNLRCELDPPDRLVVHLRDGTQEATVAVSPPPAGATSLLRALDAAMAEGYGECFWPADAGQHWWMFKREAEAMEVIAMWTRGGATGWEHVFRATDAADFVCDRLKSELGRVVRPT